MGDVDSIIEAHFERRGSELWIEELSVTDLAREYGTPLFLYSRRVMIEKLELLQRALPSGFDVYYSMKANPTREVLQVFLSQGCGLEVASSGELRDALAAGCRPERILFAGPGKTDAEIEEAVARCIGEIHAESLEEIDRVAASARRSGRKTNVALRINPGGEARGGAMQMGGKPSPFGIDEELLDAALDRMAAVATDIRFCGIHLFSGTQILDHDVLLRQYRKAIEIALRAARRTNRPLATLDFGGGLGIPYFEHETELDIAAFGRELAKLHDRNRNAPELRGARFLVEPGRYLVGQSGIYVCRLTYVKHSRGKTFLIVDGGMHHHLAASGNLGQVIKKNFPVAILNRLDEEASQRVDVVGPLCTPLDVLARNVDLPRAAAGDWFGVFLSGAYARSASPLGFLSHPGPPEVLVDGAEARLVRERGA